MENPKVSIIVPVYNTEKYLRKCINSILAQTFTDFECILVDDCSNDNSPAICDEYSVKDNRVKCIHNKDNMGSSLSRKIGLDVSRGEYIQFIDSDDWIENDMIEKVYEKAVSGNYDVVFCDAYIDELGVSVYDKTPFEDDIIKNIKQFVFCNSMGVGLPFRLTRRSIYDDVIFPNEGYAEDRYITLQVLHKVKKSAYMNSAFYHVYENPNSQIRDTSMKMEMHRYRGLKDNYKYITAFLEKIYGSNLDIFEPELSNVIIYIKDKNPRIFRCIDRKIIKNIYRAITPKSIRKIIWEKIIWGKRHKL